MTEEIHDPAPKHSYGVALVVGVAQLVNDKLHPRDQEAFAAHLRGVFARWEESARDKVRAGPADWRKEPKRSPSGTLLVVDPKGHPEKDR